MSKRRVVLCSRCQNGYMRENEAQCQECDEQDRQRALDEKYSLYELDDASTLDELKAWIRGFVKQMGAK